MALQGVQIDITARDQNVAATLQGVQAELAKTASMASGSFSDLSGEVGRAANAVGEFASAQGGAATAATSLGSSLLASAGPLVALGLVHLAVRKLTESFEESAKVEKAFAEEGEHHAQVMRDLTFETDQYISRLSGAAASERWRADELRKIANDEYKEKARLREIDDEIFNNERIGAASSTSLLKERNKELQRLAGYEQNWARERAQVEVEYTRRAEAEKTKEEEKEQAKREKEAERAAREAERRREQEQKRAFEYLKRQHDAELEGERRKVDDAAKAEDEMMKDLEKAAAHEAKISKDQYARQQKAADNFHVWELRQEEEAAKKRERVAEQYTSAIVGSFTRGLGQMIKGQGSFSDAMKSMWQGVVDVALRAIEQWVTAQIMAAIVGETSDRARAISEVSHNAGVAGSGAAASQASIPYVGPALAVAAMEAVTGAVMAQSMPLASAAGGFERVPYDQLVYTHKDEQILPAEYAEGLRRLVSGGGGGPLIGTVIATDAESFGRQLQRRDSNLVKGLELAARRRRVGRV